MEESGGKASGVPATARPTPRDGLGPRTGPPEAGGRAHAQTARPLLHSALFSPSALPACTPPTPQVRMTGGGMGKSQGTLRKRRLVRSGGGGRVGEQEKGKDVKGKKPYTAPRRALQRSGLGAGAPTLGGGGINLAGSTRGAPRGGAGLWAGPTAAPRGPAPRTNLSPCHWRASGAGPRDTRLSPPAPAPPPGRPSFRLLQEPQSAGKGNTRGCHTAPGRWKGYPPTAAQPVRLVTSTGWGHEAPPLGPGPWPSGPQLWVYRTCGMREGATLCKRSASQRAAVRAPAPLFIPSASTARPTALVLPPSRPLSVSTSPKRWARRWHSAWRSRFDSISPSSVCISTAYLISCFLL